jgi:RNA polymerase sigma factor (TIGR02999 family)
MPGGEITELLEAWSEGRRDAVDEVFARLYDELHRLARAQVRRAAGAVLTTTEVVHEAYVKLVDARRVSVSGRRHFFALAARAMRQILVDAARRAQADKRGGGAVRTSLDEERLRLDTEATAVLALDEALAQLLALDPDLGKLVELRFFGGLSVEELATTLEVSERTVKRRWRMARAILYRELGGEERP